MSRNTTNGLKWEDRNEIVISDVITSKNTENNIYSFKRHYGYEFGTARYQKNKKSYIDFAIFKNKTPFVFVECKEQLGPGSVHEKAFHVSINAEEITNFGHCDYFAISSHTCQGLMGFAFLNDKYHNSPTDKIRNFHSLSTGDESLIKLREFLESVL